MLRKGKEKDNVLKAKEQRNNTQLNLEKNTMVKCTKKIGIAQKRCKGSKGGKAGKKRCLKRVMCGGKTGRKKKVKRRRGR